MGRMPPPPLPRVSPCPPPEQGQEDPESCEKATYSVSTQGLKGDGRRARHFHLEPPILFLQRVFQDLGDLTPAERNKLQERVRRRDAEEKSLRAPRGTHPASLSLGKGAQGSKSGRPDQEGRRRESCSSPFQAVFASAPSPQKEPLRPLPPPSPSPSGSEQEVAPLAPAGKAQHPRRPRGFPDK